VSMFYYMAVGRELPVGSFGLKKTVMKLRDYLEHVNPSAGERFHISALLEKGSIEDHSIDIYETEEDAAGLIVKGPLQQEEDGWPFSHPLVYGIFPQGGQFRMDPEQPGSGRTGQKCLSELFDYLHRNLKPGETAELYAAWADGPDRFQAPRNKKLDLELRLDTFQLGDTFKWEDRQHILVTVPG
jgi:hypothetical protein